ncbi:MAG TPA: hypothetical protein VMU48_04665 [Terracidiphilus sp.]|nr:hypothetical protein [Terracidiphilus sp.]
MESILKLNLQSESEKTEGSSLRTPEPEEPKPMVPSKRLNRIVNRAAHKAALHSSRSSSGIFSK